MARSVDDAWAQLFRGELDANSPLQYISALQIKQLTGLEPRIMAKFDTLESQPPVLRDNHLFLLPVTNGNYAIVRGNGYQQLPRPTEPPQTFMSTLCYRPRLPELGLSESAKLDLAHNTGLLDHVLRKTGLIHTLRGRKYSPSFQFAVGSSTWLHAQSVQYEVDGGYENEDTIVIVEAKIAVPNNTIIRQLYYPYRALTTEFPETVVEPVFFVFEPDDTGGIYHFWHYKFMEPDLYDSMELLRLVSYKLDFPVATPPEDFQVDDLQPLIERSIGSKLEIPQADDIAKVAQMPMAVARGFASMTAIAEKFDFDPRQSSYYRHAAEALGLVVSNKGTYELTELGAAFVALGDSDRNELLARLVTSMPLAQVVIDALSASASHSLGKAQLATIICAKTPYNSTTALRRSATLLAWFRWLAEHDPRFEVSDDTIRLV